jgi:CRISPR/Cas system-associated exonuclease Cas4 (RecB family)
MSDIASWSYSALSQYARCPLQFFFQRILGLPQRSTPSPLALGSAIHEALAQYHQGVRDRRPPRPDSVVAAFRRAWEERKRQELIFYQKGTEQGHVEQGLALQEAYLKEPPPAGIVAVEQELVVPLVTSQGEVLDQQLVAVLDLVTRDPREGLKVTDLKTSSRAYSDLDGKTSLQATCYIHAAQQGYGETAVFEFAVMVKTRKPKVVRVATARMPTDSGRLGDLVQVINRAVAAGVFFPVESPLNCSSCCYRKSCREWQSDQTLPSAEGRFPLRLAEDAHAD